MAYEWSREKANNHKYYLDTAVEQICLSMSEYVTSELWSWDQQEERGRASKPSEVDMMSMAQQIKPNGMQVDVVDVCYDVVVKKSVRHLLRNINLHFEPGEMCALMGPSGAGKSTLLDLIADRKKVGMWSGEILVDQRPRSPFFNRDSAYVLQDDVHISTLTVEETIYYAAWTRMPEGTTEAQKKARVTQLLEMMGLEHVKDSMIGDAMTKGISGGQLKRLSIAVEIVSLPKLIFLDEPTSGLDSSISLEVMSAARGLANQGRTVISTIHQPSPEVFGLFDRAVLISGGRLIYSGPSDEAVAYFTRPELGYKYDKDQNPAEFIIEVCGGSAYPEGWITPRQPEELQELYNKSSFVQRPAEQLEFEPEQSLYTRRHATGKLTCFKMLMHRSWFSRIRDKKDMKTNFFKVLFSGLAIGCVFYGKADLSYPFLVEDSLTQELILVPEVNSCVSLVFISTMFNLVNNLQAIAYLCEMNIIYRRELASYAYAASPYWFAGCLSYIPILFGGHCIAMVLIYFLGGYPRDDFGFFIYFIMAMFFVNVCSFYTAQLLAARFGSAPVALAVFPITLLFLTIFSGYAIPVDEVPPGWSWAPWISYARYAFQGMIVNQFERYDEPIPYNTTFEGSQGEYVISNYGFEDFNKNDTFWIIILYMCGISIGVYLSLREPKSKLQRTVNGAVSHSLISRSSVGLRETLLPQDEVDDTSDQSILTGRSTFDVQWYRTNTGEIQLSKGCRVLFRKLHYFVKTSKGEKELLKGVSGRAQPGEMCALMGASGAGKSTLLDVLAGRKTVGKIEGEIYFNGNPRTEALVRSSAYVMQDNVHIGALTVRQTLTFAARLRMDGRLSEATRIKRIQKILDMLGLAEHADTLVGDETTRGISGGQLKRLSIGVEVINLPDLIFLDEPTTGLDSSISHEVMSAVRNLANQNRTVICTIHQPSPSVYFLFDKLLLLGDGKVTYFGPTKDVVKYFTTSPYEFKYIQGTNPADYVIAVAGAFIPASNGQKITSSDLATHFAKTEMNRVFMDSIDTMLSMDAVAVKHQASDDNLPVIEGQYASSTWNQIKTLVERLLVKTVMQPRTTIAGFIRNVIISTFLGTIYFQLSTGLEASAYTNRLAVLFFGLLSNFVSHQEVIPVMFHERLLFYRERGAKAYGAFPYWISTWVVRIPIVAINAAIYAGVYYNLIGFKKERFSFFYFTLAVHSFASSFLCQFVAHINPSAATAISNMSVFLFLNIIFSGYVIFIDDLPTWLGSWVPYISFYRYSFQAVVRNEFDNNDDLPLGDAYVENVGFNTLSKEECFSYLLILMFVYAAAGLLALKFRNFEER